MKRLFWIAIMSLYLLQGGLPGESTAEAADVRSVVYSEVASYNGNANEAVWITDAICYAASLYDVDPLLVTSVMETESHFNFGSFSGAGAIGLMQLMPGTATAVGVDPYDPLGNVIGGVSYLRSQLDSFSGYGDYAVTNAVAAYNAGGNAVRKYGGCPPFAETQNYVVEVNGTYTQLLNRYYYQ